jgi:hypothetical protein
MGLYESEHSALSPDLPISCQSDKDVRKSPEELGTTGGDTRWTKILEKPNYYVKENHGEMSAL